MNRCVPRRRAALSLIALTLFAAGTANAQFRRVFPQKALRGEMLFGASPQVRLNGVDSQLAPGARIHDTNNMLAMPASLAGQKFTVNFTLDHLGQPLEVWLLRTDEAAVTPWPKTLAEAQSWSFDPVGQTWTKP